MTEIQSRVLAVARDLLAAAVHPTARAIHARITGRDRPTAKQVEYARKLLVKAGEWPGPVKSRRPAAPAVAPPRAPSRPAREYLGPFADDIRRAAKLRRDQRGLMALSTSRPERTG